MRQEPYAQSGAWSPLADRLQQLSFREQLALLLQVSRQLPDREKLAIRRSAGVNVLRAQVFPVLLRLLVEHVLKGILSSGLAIILVFVSIVLLAGIELVNARAVLPVIVGVVALAVGCIIATFVEIWLEIRFFVRRTVSREERDGLQRALEALNPEDKVVVLRRMSVGLALREGGNIIFSILLTWLLLLLTTALLIGLILLVSALLPPLSGLPAGLLLCLVGALAFFAGLLVPRLVERFLTARQQKAHARSQ